MQVNIWFNYVKEYIRFAHCFIWLHWLLSLNSTFRKCESTTTLVQGKKCPWRSHHVDSESMWTELELSTHEACLAHSHGPLVTETVPTFHAWEEVACHQWLWTHHLLFLSVNLAPSILPIKVPNLKLLILQSKHFNIKYLHVIALQSLWVFAKLLNLSIFRLLEKLIQ